MPERNVPDPIVIPRSTGEVEFPVGSSLERGTEPAVDTSPSLHHLLAKSYLERRLFDKALQHEEKAFDLARRQGDQELAKKIADSIALCKRLIAATKQQ